VLAYKEGPESTVSVIETYQGVRELIIDGCPAASEQRGANYMQWMGTLPMIANDNPKRALVICFGTGQTARAVRDASPEHLDVVDISPEVFSLAGYFSSNGDVLSDTRVRSVVMDGRAWLRRNTEKYDVVTLEPMPPYFATSNALYSREFYDLVASRLNPGGTVAQWVPYHMLPPFYAVSITKTFAAVFPNAILWVDKVGGTGVLLGRYENDGRPWRWPGLGGFAAGDRELESNVRDYVALRPSNVAAYSDLGQIITDDNQLLSFGNPQADMFHVGGNATQVNYQILRRFSTSVLD
jgi:predicted membrane-bound spermidine synthase